MGYDMFLEDSGLGEEIDSPLSAWLHAMHVDPDAEVDDPNYFRANIWGMRELRGWMEPYGMLDWEEEFRFPSSEGFNVPKNEEGYWDEESEEYKALEAANDAVRDRDTGSVIPGAKLCSNDGWLVTPTEITNALVAYRQAVEEGAPQFPPEPEDAGRFDYKKFWNDWLAFLMRAVPAGGFRVW